MKVEWEFEAPLVFVVTTYQAEMGIIRVKNFQLLRNDQETSTCLNRLVLVLLSRILSLDVYTQGFKIKGYGIGSHGFAAA